MANNVTLPGTGAIVETIDIGAGDEQRQVVTIGPRTGATVDLLAGCAPASTHRLLSAAASTNATNVKNAAGVVKSVQLMVIRATPVYLKFYDKASSPTVGTDTPIRTIYLPGNTWIVLDFPTGLSFPTGIGYGMTTAAADNSTAALTAGDVVCLNLDYF